MAHRLNRALPGLLVVAAAVIPYLPTLGDYFIQDDFGVVGLLSTKPWSAFFGWFVSPWTDNIWGYVPDELRPFPAVSYQLAALAGSASPMPNHVINIAFHAANALLVAWVARVCGRLSPVWATIAGMVFAVLPIQSESVAWITGRVDSMPAFFYLGAFALYVRWRLDGRWTGYASALVLYAVALFTKQNTITLGPALVLYDLVVLRRPLRASWGWLGPYLPIAAMTTGYLALRYVLFGAAVREQALTAQRVRDFVGDSAVHLKHLVLGDPAAILDPSRVLLIAAVLLAAISVLVWRGWERAPRHLVGPALYFGVVWVALGMAPILVAGYYSPRHMYLAAAGWAIALGAALEATSAVRPRTVLRGIAFAAAAAAIAIYGFQLTDVVTAWNVRAMVSQRAVADVEREVLAAPEGTLILTGAPPGSWMFALPHAIRPPFTSTDLTRRAFVISSSSAHCCAADQWEAYTRDSIRAWLNQAEARPIVALYWDPHSGALSRLSDREEPYLRPLMRVLLTTVDRASLDGAIGRSLADIATASRRQN